MDVNPWFWVWVALAAILIVAEIFTAGFFMLPFAIGAASAALLEYFGVGIGWQWLAFITISAVTMIGLRRFSDRVTHEPPERVGVDRLIGRTGSVIERLEPHSSEGRVRTDREEWRADDADGRSLPVGTRVVVVRIEGTHLVVRPVEGQPEPAAATAGESATAAPASPEDVATRGDGDQ